MVLATSLHLGDDVRMVGDQALAVLDLVRHQRHVGHAAFLEPQRHHEAGLAVLDGADGLHHGDVDALHGVVDDMAGRVGHWFTSTEKTLKFFSLAASNTP